MTNHLSNLEYTASVMQEITAQCYSDAMYCRQRSHESAENPISVAIYYRAQAVHLQNLAAYKWRATRNYLDSIK